MKFKFASRQSFSNETHSRQRGLTWQTRDQDSSQNKQISAADHQAVLSDSERRLCREIGGALRAIGDNLNHSTPRRHSKT